MAFNPFLLELYSSACLVSALGALFLGAFAWFGDRKESGRAFAIVQFLVFGWSFFKYVQTRTPDPQSQLSYLRVQMTAITLLPVAAYIFGRATDGRPILGGETAHGEKARSPSARGFLAIGALLIVPMATIVFIWFSTQLPYLWSSDGLSSRPMVQPQTGPWFPFHTAYSYALVLASLWALLKRVLRSSGSTRRWYSHVTALLALPFIANGLYVVLAVNKSWIDPTPIAFAVSGLFISFALRHYNLFDAMPYTKDIILSALVDPILTVDAAGHVVGFNRAASELFSDWMPLEGRKTEEIFPFSPLDIPEGTAVEWEGGGRVFLVSNYHIASRVLRWGGTILVFGDVTERTRALRALEEREESLRKYSFMVNASRDFMSIVNHEYRYEAVNDAFCASNRLNRDEIIGATIPELWGDSVASRFIIPPLEACFRGEYVVVRSRFAFGGGSEERDLEVSYNPFRSPSGEVSHAVVVTKDVSEYLAVQRDLADARERADAANEAKSAFLASMSHEIRTPLNAVIGLTELTLGTPLSAEQRDNLETVRTAGRALLSIINDILDLSKIEAGRMSLESVDFDLPEHIGSILKTFRHAAEKKGLSIDLLVEPDTPRLVRGDPHRLGQIIMNLIGNAIKFTERGGILVTLSPTRESLSTLALGSDTESEAMADPRSLGVCVAVRDTGIGIPEDKRDIIFDSFSQADSSVSRRYGGTGLGLAICRNLASLFGGRVFLESEVGKGSVFSFSAFFEPGDAAAELEKTAAKAEELDSAASPLPSGKCFSILVVEDNPVNSRVALGWLSRAGHVARNAPSGLEALRLLSEERFDLILMDIEMPGMDGLEAARRIRAGEAGIAAAATPIIAMTAHSDVEARKACRAAGMDDFVPKPVDFSTLAGAIARSVKPGNGAGKSTDEVAVPSCSEQPLTSPDAATLGSPGAVLSDDEALIDPKGPRERLGGDEELYLELLAIFASEAEGRSAAIVAALGEPRERVSVADRDALRRLAHGIKGSSRTIGAEPLARAASELERYARSGLGFAGTAVAMTAIDKAATEASARDSTESVSAKTRDDFIELQRLSNDVLRFLAATESAAVALLPEGFEVPQE